jgi:hypothetical protein
MSVPPDIMALLQGGGAPAGPDPSGGGIPPEIMDAVSQASPRPSVADGAPGAGEDPLTEAIDLIQEAIDAEADQEDIQTMLQCQAKLQSILAKNQSESDGMMQGKASPRGIRRATAATEQPAY